MLQDAIGVNKLDASALMKYFKPIIDWLEIQNVNETIGWPENTWVPPIPEGYPEDVGEQNIERFLLNTQCEWIALRNVFLFVPLAEIDAELFLSEYNSTAEGVWNAYTEASWKYNTDINNANKKAMVR